MGERGPKPRANAVQPSRGRAGRFGTTRNRLEAPKAEAPAFPEGDYLTRTIAWWEAWVASPQADKFAATDWQRLLMLVPLVDAYFRKPTPQGMAEIRQNESKLGATAMDRERLGWTIDTPPGDESDDDKPRSSRDRPDPRRRPVH